MKFMDLSQENTYIQGSRDILELFPWHLSSGNSFSIHLVIIGVPVLVQYELIPGCI